MQRRAAGSGQRASFLGLYRTCQQSSTAAESPARHRICRALAGSERPNAGGCLYRVYASIEAPATSHEIIWGKSHQLHH